ncbi:peptidylprolyl isomerase [Cyanobium sp. NS01]|uniref:peptidylprolyl isomerase n=1 Tax=Cyanobium sp. NS01 TaxID=261284 RepID=UPI00351C7360
MPKSDQKEDAVMAAPWIHRAVARAMAWALALLLALPLQALPAAAALPEGNAVKDPAAILRNALPVEAPALQNLQHRLEDTSTDLRAKRWSALKATTRRSQSQLSSRRKEIEEGFGAGEAEQASALMAELEGDLQALASAAEVQDRDGFLDARRQALATIGTAEALLVGPFPFAIPAEFDALPRLLGRATVQISTSRGPLVAVVDGYNAPLTAGAFVDLAQKGFYDGLPFTRAEDFYVLQTGDPKGPLDGYVDPTTKELRRVPLEIKIPGEPVPFYGQTFEDLGRYKAEAVLPFATLGTLGWAHSDQSLDDGSSQFFFFLYEAELTPAGLNLVDGRYAAFGYVVEGFDVLEELGVDDVIERVQVVDGAENLQPHA